MCPSYLLGALKILATALSGALMFICLLVQKQNGGISPIPRERNWMKTPPPPHVKYGRGGFSLYGSIFFVYIFFPFHFIVVENWQNIIDISGKVVECLSLYRNNFKFLILQEDKFVQISKYHRVIATFSVLKTVWKVVTNLNTNSKTTRHCKCKSPLVHNFFYSLLIKSVH